MVEQTSSVQDGQFKMKKLQQLPTLLAISALEAMGEKQTFLYPQGYSG